MRGILCPGPPEGIPTPTPGTRRLRAGTPNAPYNISPKIKTVNTLSTIMNKFFSLSTSMDKSMADKSHSLFANLLLSMSKNVEVDRNLNEHIDEYFLTGELISYLRSHSIKDLMVLVLKAIDATGAK